MNDQSLLRRDDFGGIRRDIPRWLRALAFIAACVAISGSSCIHIPNLNPGEVKASSLASVGTSLWSTNGPYGGQIRAITIDPVSSTTIYVGGYGGVYKSVNGGTSWVAANAGLSYNAAPHLVVNAVAVSRSNPSTLYAGELNGAYKSVDGGASWSVAGVALIGSRVLALAIDPSDANKVYASANDGIYRSSDGGSSWVKSITGLNGTTPYSIAIGPGAVYTGTSDSVFKSVDGGVTWAAANLGFPVGTSNFTFSVVVDAQTPTTVYASPRSQMYKSVDSGAHWTALGVSGDNLAVDAQSPTTLYAGGTGGLSKSTNGGTSWTAVNSGLNYSSIDGTAVLAVAVDSRAGGGAFVGTEGGVFRSTNGGSNWAASNAGLTNLIVTALAINPLTPTTIYAGTRNSGVFKSIDGGASWVNSSNGLNQPLGSGNWVMSLAIDPVTPTTLYAGSGIFSFVYKSVDGGATWRAAATGVAPQLPVSALAIDPTNSQIVVAGTLNGGIYRSTNAGASWTAITAGLPSSTTIYGLSFGSTSPQTLLAAVRLRAGGDSYMASTDSGATWLSVYPGYDPSKGAISTVDFLHKTLGIKSIALGYDGAFLPPYPPPYPAISGIDFRDCTQVTAVLFDPNSVDQGYVGADCGVGKGTTANLAAINAGLPGAGIKALAITPSGNTLYAGTDGSSVYQYSADKKLGVVTEFYNPVLDYYFMSSRASDVALLDTLAAWRRTGKAFSVYIAQETGTLGINRYYFDQVAVNKSRGSHFYTLVQSEKDSLASLNPGNTQTPRLPYNEGVDSYAFAPLIEGVGGSCAAGQTPVYRIFRGQARFPDNPNHRFTTELAIYNSFVALGWDGEGVKFCVPN